MAKMTINKRKCISVHCFQLILNLFEKIFLWFIELILKRRGGDIYFDKYSQKYILKISEFKVNFVSTIVLFWSFLKWFFDFNFNFRKK